MMLGVDSKPLGILSSLRTQTGPWSGTASYPPFRHPPCPEAIYTPCYPLPSLPIPNTTNPPSPPVRAIPVKEYQMTCAMLYFSVLWMLNYSIWWWPPITKFEGSLILTANFKFCRVKFLLHRAFSTSHFSGKCLGREISLTRSLEGPPGLLDFVLRALRSSSNIFSQVLADRVDLLWDSHFKTLLTVKWKMCHFSGACLRPHKRTIEIWII